MKIFECSSGVQDYLKPFGYGTLALPKAGIRPLTMLGKRGKRLTPIGPLAATFRPGITPLPEALRDRTADLSGSKSRDLEVSLGLDILGSVIGALSGSSLGIKAAYNDARTVTFEFGDVMETKIDITALDSYLSAASVSPAAGPYLRTVLNDDQVYVVVTTVDASKLTVAATAKSGASLGLEVPVVQQLVGGKIAVSGATASSGVLTYTSTETPLVFGVQVVRLEYDGERYRTLKLVKAGDIQVANVRGAPDETAVIVPDAEIEF